MMTPGVSKVDGKQYLKHRSSVFNLWGRNILIIIILASLLINAFSTLFLLGWVPILIVYYIEKESLFVKYHSLLGLLLEILKGSLLFILSIISLNANLPYYYGIFTESSFQMGIMGYLDIFINLVFVAITIYQIVQIYNYKELNIKWLNKLIYWFLMKDPKFDKIEKNTPLR